MTSPAKRILVVLDPSVGHEAAVRGMLEREASEIYVISPVLSSRLGWLTNDDDDANVAAEQRLDEALTEAADVGVAAQGTVGSDDDLLTVIGDALAQFPADEVVVATRSDQERHWRVDDLAEKVRARHGKPLRALAVSGGDGAGPGED